MQPLLMRRLFLMQSPPLVLTLTHEMYKIASFKKRATQRIIA